MMRERKEKRLSGSGCCDGGKVQQLHIIFGHQLMTSGRHHAVVGCKSAPGRDGKAVAKNAGTQHQVCISGWLMDIALLSFAE